MRKLRVVLIAAFAICAFASVASAAQAHEFKVEGAGVGTGVKLANKAYGGKFVLVGKPFGVTVHIECTKVSVTGELKAAGLDTEQLTFNTCSVEKPAKCGLKQTTTKGPTSLVELGGALADKFEGEGATSVFTTVTLENNGGTCSLAAKPFEVTGSQTCELPGAGVEAAGHTVACTAAGSKLEAGGKEATFSGTVEGLEVEGGKLWSAV